MRLPALQQKLRMSGAPTPMRCSAAALLLPCEAAPTAFWLPLLPFLCTRSGSPGELQSTVAAHKPSPAVPAGARGQSAANGQLLHSPPATILALRPRLSGRPRPARREWLTQELLGVNPLGKKFVSCLNRRRCFSPQQV